MHDDIAAIIDDAPVRRMDYWLWLLATGGTLVDGMAVFTLGVAMPLIIARFAIPPHVQGLLAAALVFGAVAGALIGGPAADRSGRRPMMLLAMLMTSPAPAMEPVELDVATRGIQLEQAAAAARFGAAQADNVNGRLRLLHADHAPCSDRFDIGANIRWERAPPAEGTRPAPTGELNLADVLGRSRCDRPRGSSSTGSRSGHWWPSTTPSRPGSSGPSPEETTSPGRTSTSSSTSPTKPHCSTRSASRAETSKLIGSNNRRDCSPCAASDAFSFS